MRADKTPKQRTMVGNLEVQEFVDHNLIPEVGSLLKERRVESKAPGRRAARPFPRHRADVDFLGFHADALRPPLDLLFEH